VRQSNSELLQGSKKDTRHGYLKYCYIKRVMSTVIYLYVYARFLLQFMYLSSAWPMTSSKSLDACVSRVVAPVFIFSLMTAWITITSSLARLIGSG
jgi:hypothetical protein